jgi:hypothetical protein
MKGYAGLLGSFAHSRAILCASDFRIEDNSAPEGSALHLDDDSNPTAAYGSYAVFNGCTTLPGAARRCAAGVACNTLDGNVAQDANSTPTLGAVVYIGGESRLDGNRFALRHNRGGYGLRGSGSADWTTLANCLMTGSTLTRHLIETGNTLQVTNCTLAGNTIQSTAVINALGGLRFIESLIDQPGNLALDYSGPADGPAVAYVMSTDTSTLPDQPDIIEGAPAFVDAANGDYHLAPASPGLDFAPRNALWPRDLDNQPRDIDQPGVADLWGPRDLGAYERARTQACTVADTVLCDTFEL